MAHVSKIITILACSIIQANIHAHLPIKIWIISGHTEDAGLLFLDNKSVKKSDGCFGQKVTPGTYYKKLASMIEKAHKKYSNMHIELQALDYDDTEDTQVYDQDYMTHCAKLAYKLWQVITKQQDAIHYFITHNNTKACDALGILSHMATQEEITGHTFSGTTLSFQDHELATQNPLQNQDDYSQKISPRALPAPFVHFNIVLPRERDELKERTHIHIQTKDGQILHYDLADEKEYTPSCFPVSHEKEHIENVIKKLAIMIQKIAESKESE